MTEWKAIQEFPAYEISSDGRIRSIGGPRKFGHTIRIAPRVERALQPHSGGYLQVRLYSRDGGQNLYVHRLVALAFVTRSNPSQKHVNHLNGNKHDNRPENLEWATSSENHLHKTRVLKKGTGETHSQARLSSDDVSRLRMMEGTQQEIADAFGISRGHAGDILNGRKRARG